MIHQSPSFEQRRKLELRRPFASILRQIGWPPERADQELRSIAVTACSSGEGVTLVTSQVAIAAATSSGLRVLLVDANLTNPGIAELFHLPSPLGLCELLRGEASLGEVLKPTSIGNLHVVSAGNLGRGIASGSAGQLSSFLQVAEDEFDLVLFDVPPVDDPSLTSRLIELTDGTVLVVQPDHVTQDDLLRTRQLIRRSGALLMGTVLNQH